MVVKVSVLIKVGVGTVRAGKVRGVGDGNSDSITINSSLKRTRSGELIMYIRVNCI